jgi:hypothetical protein
MQWDGLSTHQETLRKKIIRLTHARAAHSALRRGTRSVLWSSDDALVYEMRDDSEKVLVVLNRADYEVQVEGVPAGSYVDAISEQEMGAPTRIGARSALVLVGQ